MWSYWEDRSLEQRTHNDIISSATQHIVSVILFSNIFFPSEKYWGHDIVGKLAHRKFHQSFTADLVTFTFSHSFPHRRWGDHRGTISLSRVSNSAAWLVLQTGTFLFTDIPHMCTNVQPSAHTQIYTHRQCTKTMDLCYTSISVLFLAFKATFFL